MFEVGDKFQKLIGGNVITLISKRISVFGAAVYEYKLDGKVRIINDKMLMADYKKI